MVGRTIRIAQVPHTVVGVMPEGFFFPTRQHLWLPLRGDPGEALPMVVFGRLADGTTEEQAQAELIGITPLTSEALQARRGARRLEVVPFGLTTIGVPAQGLDSMAGFNWFQALALGILLVAAGNVAMLVFARTATRFRELALRAALGASRVRIASQVFAEALALAVLAVGIGLFAIDWALGRAMEIAVAMQPVFPYWLTLAVTREAVIGCLILAVVSATVAGVLPALWVTGKKNRANVQSGGAGRSAIRFGRVTSALIIVDVAVAVTVLGGRGGVLSQDVDGPRSNRLGEYPRGRVPRGRTPSAHHDGGGGGRGLRCGGLPRSPGTHSAGARIPAGGRARGARGGGRKRTAAHDTRFPARGGGWAGGW